MSEEFIKEVDEDIKEEKRIKLWKKLIPYVISFSLTIILFTSGFVFWKNYTRNSNQTLGDDFTAAVDLANEDDTDAALLALDRIVDKGSDGYATIAKMKKASLLIDRGLSDEKKAEWVTYRQTLRDLPANTSDPENPTWPTQPS